MAATRVCSCTPSSLAAVGTSLSRLAGVLSHSCRLVALPLGPHSHASPASSLISRPLVVSPSGLLLTPLRRPHCCLLIASALTARPGRMRSPWPRCLGPHLMLPRARSRAPARCTSDGARVGVTSALSASGAGTVHRRDGILAFQALGRWFLSDECVGSCPN